MAIARIPPLHLLDDDTQRIVLWYAERERSAGWLAGYDYAQRQHWALPDYETAVDTLIDIGSFGIERREAERRRETA